MWGGVLAVILLGTGLLYTVTLKVPQIRCAKHILGSLKSTLKSDDGSVSGFAALCAAVGGQVGTGSLVGVASALVAGGPGAMLWMWITAVFGMVLSFSEASLGQLFHEKDALELSIVKMLAMPFLAWAVMLIVPAGDMAKSIFLVTAALPAAVVVPMMVEKYGYGEKMSSDIVLLTTLISVVELPACVWLTHFLY